MYDLTFKTKREVIAMLASIESIVASENSYTSILSNYPFLLNEYAQPEYSPRRYKDGWGIHREFKLTVSDAIRKSGRVTDGDNFYVNNP